MNDIRIYDDWLDADLFRARALSRRFSVRGNYPGLRTRPDPLLLHHLSKHCNPSWVGRDYTGAYQMRMQGVTDWIHSDLQQWAAVVYLNKEYPDGHGTTFWRDTDGNERRQGEKDPQCEYQVCGYVPGAYGRLVVYPGQRYHCAGIAGFGATPDTARLTAVFFWNDQ